MAVQITWVGPLVNPNGTLSQPFISYLQSLRTGISDAGSATDLAALTDRVDALEEGDNFPALYPGTGITITGDADSGYTITLSSGELGPLPCQIFGS